MAKKAKERKGKSRVRKWRRSGYRLQRKVCSFCSEKVKVIGYKDPTQLRKYISDRGKILPRRRTGTCARHQRALAVAIKRARHLALLPYIPAHMRKTGGVGLSEDKARV